MQARLSAMMIALLTLSFASLAYADSCANQIIDHTETTAHATNADTMAVACKNGRVYLVKPSATSASCRPIQVIVDWLPEVPKEDRTDPIKLAKHPPKTIVQTTEGTRELDGCVPGQALGAALKKPEARAEVLNTQVGELMKTDQNAAFDLLKQGNQEVSDAINNAYGPSTSAVSDLERTYIQMQADPENALKNAEKLQLELDTIAQSTDLTDMDRDRISTIRGDIQDSLIPAYYDYQSRFQVSPQADESTNLLETKSDQSFDLEKTFTQPQSSQPNPTASKTTPSNYDPNSSSIFFQEGETQQQYFCRLFCDLWQEYVAEPVSSAAAAAQNYAQSVWSGFNELGFTDTSESVPMAPADTSNTTQYFDTSGLVSSEANTDAVSVSPVENSASVPIDSVQNDTATHVQTLQPDIDQQTVQVTPIDQGENSSIDLPVKRPENIPVSTIPPEALAATNLADYFDAMDKSLPTKTERAALAAQYGIANYSGTSAQNSLLLKRLQGK